MEAKEPEEQEKAKKGPKEEKEAKVEEVIQLSYEIVINKMVMILSIKHG